MTPPSPPPTPGSPSWGFSVSSLISIGSVGFSPGSIPENRVMPSTPLSIWLLISGQIYRSRRKIVGCLLLAFCSASFTFRFKLMLITDHVFLLLEASIRNGDIQGFQFFRNVSDQLSSNNSKKGRLNQHRETSEEGSKEEKKNLPHAQEHSRDIGGWEDSERPLQYRQRSIEDLDDDGEERKKH